MVVLSSVINVIGNTKIHCEWTAFFVIGLNFIEYRRRHRVFLPATI